MNGKEPPGVTAECGNLWPTSSRPQFMLAVLYRLSKYHLLICPHGRLDKHMGAQRIEKDEENTWKETFLEAICVLFLLGISFIMTLLPFSLA